MTQAHRLIDQARKCRRLAFGLTNRDDIRTLEALAAELEEKARAAGAWPGRPEVAH
jgi:hypothetical protein